MKLVRFGRAGAERPGVIDADGKLRDLSRVIKDVTPAALAPAALRRLRAAKLARLPTRARPTAAGLPAGLHRQDGLHRAQLHRPRGRGRHGAPQGAHPVHQGAERDLRRRRSDRAPARRGEARLRSRARRRDGPRRALRRARPPRSGYVAGYCLVNDVSERAFQMEHGGTTTKGKSAGHVRSHGPVARHCRRGRRPAAAGAVDDGQRRASGRTGNTAKMIFSVAALIAYVSRFMSLRAGDVISRARRPAWGTARSRRSTWCPGTWSRWGSPASARSATRSSRPGSAPRGHRLSGPPVNRRMRPSSDETDPGHQQDAPVGHAEYPDQQRCTGRRRSRWTLPASARPRALATVEDEAAIGLGVLHARPLAVAARPGA